MKKEPIKSTKPVFNTTPETIAKLEEEIARLKEYVDKLETKIKKQDTTTLTIKNQKAKAEHRFCVLQAKYDKLQKIKTPPPTEYLKKIQDMFGGMVECRNERRPEDIVDLKPDEPNKNTHKTPPRY